MPKSVDGAWNLSFRWGVLVVLSHPAIDPAHELPAHELAMEY